MSDQGTTTASARTTPRRDESGWVVWAAFAGVLALLTGIFHVLNGIVALAVPDFYVVGEDGLVLTLDWTVWGVVHLAMGSLLIAVGLGIMAGREWARWTGVGLVAVSAVQNMLFVPAYPVWGTIMLAMDVLILWALLAHGRALRDYR